MDIPAIMTLAMQHYKSGRYEQSGQMLKQIIANSPKHFDALHYLGVIYYQSGNYTAAISLLNKAIDINPNHAAARSNLGNVYKDSGLYPEAVASYKKAIELKPDYAIGYNNLGTVLKESGSLIEAAECYKKAIKFRSDNPNVYRNLGNVYFDLQKFKEAIVCYKKSIELNADCAETYFNIGNAIKKLSGKLQDAIDNYRKAISLKPDYPEVYFNLATTYKDLGLLKDAEETLTRAHMLKPEEFYITANYHLLLPVIYNSREQIEYWFSRYKNGIKAMENIQGLLKNPGKTVNTNSFYLAYHNHNTKHIMESLCLLFRKRSEAMTFKSQHIELWKPPENQNRKIRIGFISEFLSRHTIGKLYHGFIAKMDRNKFEIILIHAPNSKHDSFKQKLDNLADKFLNLPGGELSLQQKMIANEKLDILFYTDIGMSQSTYFLAYSRLAPIQAVSWGHPDTTGLNTIDYFISASSIEPPSAVENYTETLICLSRLPCYYQPFIAPNKIVTRSTLGLPESGNIYGCPQSLFKIHPDFDIILSDIASGDPDGHIVFIESHCSSWTKLLKDRWAETFPELHKKAIFLPRMTMWHFLSLIAHTDVLLDPIYFGSGNTLYEAMLYGTPIVTLPGRYMRGRIVAGAYRQIGITDPPIASSPKNYVALTLELALNKKRREALKQEILAASGTELFVDHKALREFELFAEAAVKAAGRGEKLPLLWKPHTN